MKKSTKAMVCAALFFIVSSALAGCTADSIPPEEQTLAERAAEESKEEPEADLTDNELIFKSDVEGLTEQIIPDYELEKIEKHYAGNEEAGGKIHESDTMTSISYDEIGDEAVSIDRAQAVAMARDWIGTAFRDFDMGLLDRQDPVVMDMRQTLVDGSEELVTGYNVKYSNRYEGIKILYEGISVMLDDSGITYGTIEWNEYKKVESSDDNKTVQKVDFEQSKTLLAEVIKKENEELGLETDSEETRCVSAVELVFAQKWEEETYKPVWFYEMEDGRSYFVDCMDGMVSHP